MKDKITAITKIDISTMTFIKVVLVIFTIWFLFVIRGILAILFFSLILSSAIDPIIHWMESKKIHRIVGVIIVYLLILGGISAVVALLVPVIISQTQELRGSLGLYLERLSSGYETVKYYSTQYGLSENLKSTLNSITSAITSDGKIFSLVTGVVGGFFSFVMILVITFYMLVSEDSMKKAFRLFTPKKYLPFLTYLLSEIQRMTGLWFRGQMILCLIVGGLCYVGLFFIGMPYALVLALICGITELVPYAGPILGAIPAVFIALTISPFLAIAVVILYIVVQELENNFIVPKVMQKAVGLNPIVSISALLIGAKVGGVLGAIMAIPVATAIIVVINEAYSEHHHA